MDAVGENNPFKKASTTDETDSISGNSVKATDYELFVLHTDIHVTLLTFPTVDNLYRFQFDYVPSSFFPMRLEELCRIMGVF